MDNSTENVSLVNETFVSDECMNEEREKDDQSRHMDTEWDDWTSLLSTLSLQKHPHEITSTDMLNKQFISPEAAARFYQLFAKYTGFSVREGRKRKSVSREIRSYTWMCSREGYQEKKYLGMEGRARAPRQLTRTGCKVVFRIALNRETGMWDVRQFVCQHKHPTASLAQIHLLRSHRGISNGTLETAKQMQSVGIKSWQIMNYMVEQKGGYEKTGFVMKDLWNKLGEEEMMLAETDAARAIGYLQRNVDGDPGYYAKYSVDDQRRLLSLVWADSMMKNDYQCFGRTIGFDTTYRTNKYKKPLVVFVGVNNHFRTTVVGFALVMDETVETYKWTLQSFVDCMKGIAPTCVITDGDPAMRRAILEVMPNAVHRLCAWHLEKNAGSNVKNPEFLIRFKKLMFRLYTETDFEDEWIGMVRDLNLEGNAWVRGLYERRQSWADTFLRGKYFAGMTTTQRNEGMNSHLKTKLNPKSSLYQLMRHLARGVDNIRQQQIIDDFVTQHSVPVIGETNMVALERQLAEIYTSRMFYKVRLEMTREGKYLLKATEENGNNVVCWLNKYGDESIVRRVSYDKCSQVFMCECSRFESCGIPCRHIFATMKSLQIMRMPESLVNRHWLKDAKRGLHTSRIGRGIIPTTEEIESGRFGQITSVSAEIAYYASKNEELFRTAKTRMNELVSFVRDAFENDVRTKTKGFVPTTELPNVQNPKYSQSKGSASAPSGKPVKKQCRWCKVRGHNKQTCPVRKAEERAAQNETSPMNESQCYSNQGINGPGTHLGDGFGNIVGVVGLQDSCDLDMGHESNSISMGFNDQLPTERTVNDDKGYMGQSSRWWGDRGF